MNTEKSAMTGSVSRKRCVFTAIIYVFLLCFLLISCGEEGRSFKHCELGIVLNEGFYEYDSGEAFDVAYTDGELIVGILRLSHDAGLKDGIPATLSPKRFAEYYIARAGIEAEITSHGYTPICEYTLDTELSSYDYLLSFYRTDYAYFVIGFVCPSARTEEQRDQILEFIDSVYYEE